MLSLNNLLSLEIENCVFKIISQKKKAKLEIINNLQINNYFIDIIMLCLLALFCLVFETLIIN